jgi:ribosomal protein L9
MRAMLAVRVEKIVAQLPLSFSMQSRRLSRNNLLDSHGEHEVAIQLCDNVARRLSHNCPNHTTIEREAREREKGERRDAER